MSISSFTRNWGREISTGALSGIMAALSFPPYPARVFSLFALVPVFWYFLGEEGAGNRKSGFLKRGFLVCYIFGVVFFGILLHWVANVIPDSNVTARWVLAPGVSLLVLYLALYPGLFGLALAYLIRRYGRGAVVAAPALYPLAELLRSSGELAFSWGLLSGALLKYPIAVQGLSIYGSYGLSFFIVLVNLLLAVVLFSKQARMRLACLALLILVVLSHVMFGVARVRHYREVAGGIDRKNIAVVQPNVGLDIKWKPEYKNRIFREIEKLTAEAAGRGAELVIFPETSAPVSISRSAGYRVWLERIAAGSGVDLLIGFIDHTHGEDEIKSHNGAGLFNRQGKLEARYRKVNLLPFGEKIPFSQYFPALKRIKFGQANFTSGTRETIFSPEAGDFGVLICYESTFPAQSRDYILNGAGFLVNITNDGWFNSQRGPIQHSESAIMRAVENGVYMLRSANTGVSMYIDPAGRVLKKLGLNEEGTIYCGIKEPAGLTFYTRHGNLVFYVLAVLSLAGAILHRSALPRSRRRE
ncbi:MAG: apolipoprotein N-acyltransferase [Candidatus Krumholzibacteriales bacterium]